MSNTVPAIAREPRRLASVFDQFPPGTPLSLDALELAMSREIECRCMAALDRALARLCVREVVQEESGPSPLLFGR